MTDIVDAAPQTIHRGVEDLPFVELADGTLLQLLHVDLASGIWTVRNQFPPGTTIQTHRHTGHVHAFTQSGSWHYLESPEAVNRAGSYLFEPAGSIHTLQVPAPNDGPTEVCFTINGANLNLDETGTVVSVVDAGTILWYYRHLCADQHGLPDPPVVIVGT